VPKLQITDEQRAIWIAQINPNPLSPEWILSKIVDRPTEIPTSNTREAMAVIDAAKRGLFEIYSWRIARGNNSERVWTVRYPTETQRGFGF